MKRKAGICLIVFCMIFGIVNVAAQGQITLKTDRNRADFGEGVSVSVDLSRENPNLYVYTARLSYDKEVFEEISKDSFEDLGNWSDITYHGNSGRFVLIRKSGKEIFEKDRPGQLRIKFKVKEKSKAGRTLISINSITASDGEKDVGLDSQSAEIEIIQNGLGKNESIPINEPAEVSDEKLSIEAAKDSPVRTALLFFLIIAVSIFVIMFDIRSAGNRKKKVIATAVGVAVVAILLIPAVKSVVPKTQDIDQNGIVDYRDTQQIINSLLENDSQDKTELKKKDLNSDGAVTATDIARSLDNVKNQEYQGKISDKS